MRENLVQRSMPNFEGKRVVNVTAKIKPQQKELLMLVCATEDRTMSYVVSELAMRGLAQYKKDGRLKLSPEEEKILAEENKPKKVAPDKVKLIKPNNKGKEKDVA